MPSMWMTSIVDALSRPGWSDARECYQLASLWCLSGLLAWPSHPGSGSRGLQRPRFARSYASGGLEQKFVLVDEFISSKKDCPR